MAAIVWNPLTLVRRTLSPDIWVGADILTRPGNPVPSRLAMPVSWPKTQHLKIDVASHYITSSHRMDTLRK